LGKHAELKEKHKDSTKNFQLVYLQSSGMLHCAAAKVVSPVFTQMQENSKLR